MVSEGNQLGRKVTTHVVYSSHYSIGFFGLERLHPFDSRKYSRGYRLLKQELGRKFRERVVTPRSQVTRKELL